MSFIKPFEDFCNSVTPTTQNVVDFIIKTYVPFLITEISKDRTLSLDDQKQVVIQNIMEALKAGGQILDKKLPLNLVTWNDSLVAVLQYTLPPLLDHLLVPPGKGWFSCC